MSRRRYLKEEIKRERSTLTAIERNEGEMAAVARLMVELTIRQFETELEWLNTVSRELGVASGPEAEQLRRWERKIWRIPPPHHHPDTPHPKLPAPVKWMPSKGPARPR